MKKAFVILTLVIGIVSCKDIVNEIPDAPFGTTAYSFTNYNDTILPPLRIPSDNKLTNEGVQLGRMLFYDPILSADSTQSCGSCHNQADAFTDNGLALSEGIKGAKGKRNSMPIFNLMWHLDGFFWDNRSDILRHQALEPIQDPLEMDETIGNVLAKLSESTMYQDAFKKAFNTEEIDEEQVGKALEQFMLSIVSGNSKFDRVQLGLESFTDQEMVGQIIFNAEAIRLEDEINPNVDKTGPYMHDGRFTTLEEVVDFYLGDVTANSPIDLADAPNMHGLKDSVYLSDEHKAALVSFLKTLTDDTYLTNEEYSNPF